jgi:hypothetical protein
MSFNIGSQHASVINNVAGDQYNNITSAADAAIAVERLGQLLEQSQLPDDVARLAREQLELAASELALPSPDKPAVADRLGRLTKALASAGALATAGASLTGPLTSLAGWLGTLGDPILRLLSP